ncbi:hypothetical protein BCR35DRAFT_265160 [Leucosporidium creatinivorum]|uniref:RFX1-4/6/8-like BCD domain-containing protein n=1 Tax=Leucosporidium creatinivorum TaxID=106004 RepID=A0A1Y2FHW8_9BASI|nr:hypothetical protein BCR35DRAFT_265160 [Leucosporidium creatinivorum]
MQGFPIIEEVLGSGSGEGGPVRDLWTSFARHCDGLLESMKASRFDQFELAIRTWWATLTAEQVALVQHPLVSQLIYRGELALYENCLDFLHGQITVGLMAEQLGSLRTLAEGMESTQRFALAPFDGSLFAAPKVELAARFAHLLKRHLGLVQLGQALVVLLTNAETLQAMKDAWDLIDLKAIKNQCEMTLDCDCEALAETLDGERGLGFLLKSEQELKLQVIINWVDTTFHHLGSSSSKELFLKWSFASKEIIRDLTLRSDPSFGSFHIACSFIDELLSFKVSCKRLLSC